MCELDISLGGVTDLTAASTGTLYYVSNPAIAQVSAAGCHRGTPGVATITVINGPAEQVIPVEVEPPEPARYHSAPTEASSRDRMAPW